MPNLQQVALMMMQRNPNAANSPMGQRFMQILQSGDSQAGQALAQEYCHTMGMTPQQAMQDVQNSTFLGQIQQFLK